MKQKITLDVIAQQLGVTKVTVSKALKDQPGVSEELKKRIIDTANSLGYAVKKQDRPFSSVSKLGFFVPKRFFLDNDNFYTQIFYYTTNLCTQKNISLYLHIINPDEEKNEILPASLGGDKNGMNGIFVAGEIADSYMDVLLGIGVPITAVDFYKYNHTTDRIVIDNYQSGYLAANYLIRKGHSRIGFVGNPNYSMSVMDRFCGYIKALTSSGIEYNKDWHLVNNDDSGIYGIDYMLPAVLPTAFVCHCDMAAYHLMMKLQSNGIAVPEQVSLISFDNTELSQNTNPNLTSLDINCREIATRAFDLMLWRIQNPEEEKQSVVIHTKIMERNSVVLLD